MNIFDEPTLIQDTYTEYLRLIKHYYNIKRLGPLIKYYNLNMDISVVNDDLNSSYAIYSNSGIKFDLFEFTPIYYLTPLVNISSSVSDLNGQMMDATTTINIYTIAYPRIHDIVAFYAPIQNNREIFRVTNIKTPTNALVSSPSLSFFELDLEYAPLLSLESLKVNERYIYDFAEEDYMLYENFLSKTDTLSRLEEKFISLMGFYSQVYDMFILGSYAPLLTNELIIRIKRVFAKNYNRIFEILKFPFGFQEYYNENYNFQPIENNCDVLNLETNQIETLLLSLNPELNNICELSNQILNILGELNQ